MYSTILKSQQPFIVLLFSCKGSYAKDKNHQVKVKSYTHTLMEVLSLLNFFNRLFCYSSTVDLEKENMG